MQWASAISQDPEIAGALSKCTREVKDLLGTAHPPHLVLLFISSRHEMDWECIATAVNQDFPKAVIIGCSGAGVIGASQEIEFPPAISLTVGHLPGVNITPFRFTADNLPSPDAPPDDWWREIKVLPEDNPQFILLIDAFSTASDSILAGLDFAYPKSPKVGGLASGGAQRNGNVLFLGAQVYRAGVVGVSFSGNVTMDTVVAQGCRPIGDPMRVTEARGNLLLTLDGEPALAALQGLYERLTIQDQSLMVSELFLGIATDAFDDRPGPGTFLVRNLLGGDPENGILAIGSILHEGQVVQFHVRDAMASHEDLDQSLRGHVMREFWRSSAGAILFSCVGRGHGLYGYSNHDSDLFRTLLGNIPLGGFFCDGEIGPVGDATYLHGYTSSFGIFRPSVDPN